MPKLPVFCCFVILLLLTLSCQNRSNQRNDPLILFKKSSEYNKLQKVFSIDAKSASSIYTNWYMKKFSISESQEVKGYHDLIINESYFYCYDFDKKVRGIPLVGLAINGYTGEVKEINLGFRIIRTNSGYKKIKEY